MRAAQDVKWTKSMTHQDDTHRATIEGLQRLLDTFGADRSRWPARERLRYSGLVAENDAARRLLAEAEALDRVLDLAPEPDVGSLDALSARIMESAGAAGRQATSRDKATMPTVVPLRPHGGSSGRGAQADRLGWQAAALLAASVMIGVFVGTSGIGIGPAEAPSTVAEDDRSGDVEGDWDASQLALGNDEADAFDLVEEML